MKAQPHPELLPLVSTMARAAHYDPHTQALHVEYLNGKVFRYDGVPADHGSTIMGAASFGGALNKHVLSNRTKFPGKQVA